MIANIENNIVAQLAEILALEHGIAPARARQIRTAAALHDIGKQRIDPRILNKPGKLTAAEFEVVKTHTTLGAELLAGMLGEVCDMARSCCLYHHEWYNGGGYWGKRTEELPCYVPYVSIADVFTALVSKRPYKEPWPPDDAIDYIKKQAGTQFSPDLAEVFLWLVERDQRVSALFRLEGRH